MSVKKKCIYIIYDIFIKLNILHSNENKYADSL